MDRGSGYRVYLADMRDGCMNSITIEGLEEMVDLRCKLRNQEPTCSNSSLGRRDARSIIIHAKRSCVDEENTPVHERVPVSCKAHGVAKLDAIKSATSAVLVVNEITARSHPVTREKATEIEIVVHDIEQVHFN